MTFQRLSLRQSDSCAKLMIGRNQIVAKFCIAFEEEQKKLIDYAFKSRDSVYL